MRPHLLFMFSLLLPAAAWSEPPKSAIEWLNRMSEASHSLNYEGIFTYEHEGRMQTMQLFHGTDGEEERDRLIALDGASREVVREGGKVTAILPDHKSVVVDDAGEEAPLPINVPTRIDQLESFYQPKVGGQARIAGQIARRIMIVPRDRYRYGQSLWLDEKTGLLLKAELRDERNKVVEQLVFTRLKIYDGELPDQVLKPSSPAKDLTWYSHENNEPASGAVESRWVVTRVPTGFREEMRRTHSMPGANVPVEHRVFTDGFASVSVFIEPIAKPHKGAAVRIVRKGALNAYTRYVNNYKVTVLGDVPAATVRLIGESVTVADKTKR